MEETIQKFCTELKTGVNFTYTMPPLIPTWDCDYTWKAEDGTVLGYGRRNLTVSSCLKVVYFLMTCEGGDKPGESTFTYRVNDTTSIPVGPAEPSEGKLLWLLVLLLLLLIPVLYFVLKRFKRPEYGAVNTDQRNGDAVNTDQRNGDAVNTDQRNGDAVKVSMLPLNTES